MYDTERVWPDSYQERNVLMLHWHNMITIAISHNLYHVRSFGILVTNHVAVEILNMK
jgi:hypothetical protein